MRLVLGVGLLAGCGRWGFGGEDAGAGGEQPAPDDVGVIDAPTSDTDASIDAALDASMVVDAPAGPDYAVTSSTTTYVSPAGAVPVPGFIVGADDESYPMTLPFAFSLYGVPYSSINISVNGYVTFDTPPTGVDTYSNDCLLDAVTPDAAIAVFWDDLFSNMATAPSGAVNYAQGGASPDRWFAVEWKELDAYYRAGAGNNAFSQGLRVTHQLVLRESGVIDLIYGPRTAPTLDRDCGLERQRGCSATIGVEGAVSTRTRTVQCGTAAGTMAGFTPIDPGRMIRLSPI